MIKDFLRIEDACQVLHITPQAVSLLCRQGKLPGAVQPWGKGRGWLIPAKSVNAYAKKQAAGTLPKGGRPRKSNGDNVLQNPQKSTPKSR